MKERVNLSILKGILTQLSNRYSVYSIQYIKVLLQINDTIEIIII